MIISLLRKLTGRGHSRSQAASVAKERLQIVVAHHRRNQNLPDFVKHLEKDILDVLKKYVDVDSRMINVNLEQNDAQSKLELNVTLPQNEAMTEK